MGLGVDEGLLVLDDVRVPDARQDSHLVDSVLFVFEGLGANFDLLEGVDLAVLDPAHLVDRGVGSVAQLLQDHEVAQLRAALVLHLIGVAEVLPALLLLW